MVRVLSGVVLAAIFLTIVWFSSAAVLLFVAFAVCVMAFHEYAQLMHQIGADFPKLPTLLATLAALVIVPFPYVAGEAVVATGLIVIAVSVMLRRSSTSSVSADVLGVAAGALSVIYLGLTLGTLVGVHIFGGRGAVVLLVGTVAISDTAQFYAGRMFGRHRLAARLSPKKTVEGALGGFVVAPIVLFFAGPELVPVATPLTIAAVGPALVAAGIAGDLFESLLKRAATVKDSSTLIPGHGGVLDRIDALLFASPLFYVYIRWQYTP